MSAPPAAASPVETPAPALDLAALAAATGKPDGSGPEVSELLAAPPRLAARGLLYVILGAVAAAVLWAALSPFDIVVETRGAVTTEGRGQAAQARAEGAVSAVYVREGAAVRRGQALLELDSAERRARRDKLAEEREVTRRQFVMNETTRTRYSDGMALETRMKQLDREIADEETAIGWCVVRAPVSGVVSSLTVRRPGAVVKEGQSVAEITPAGEPLVAEVRVPNRDVGLLREGQAARVKVDALPYQEFGTLPGRVTRIAPDAQSDAGGSYYVAEVTLDRDSVSGRGRRIGLRPGMALTASIVTERTTVLDVLLDPVRKLREGGG